MANKKQITLTLYEDDYNYLKEIKLKTNARSISAALGTVVNEHRAGSGDQVNAVADKVIEKLDEKYRNIFTRIRLGTSTADKNSQIILEILNSMILNQGLTLTYDTDTVESDIVREGKDIVKKRIENYKQRKDSRT